LDKHKPLHGEVVVYLPKLLDDLLIRDFCFLYSRQQSLAQIIGSRIKVCQIIQTLVSFSLLQLTSYSGMCNT
jgi:hypothetical protein